MADGQSTTAPSRKRKTTKRTARACDECRLRKAKCDGLQPCEACQSTDRYCTFNLSAGRSTGSGTRIRVLEDRLRRARAYLNEAQKRTPSLADVDFDALLGPTEDYARPETDATYQPGDDDHEKLESMMDSYGQLNLDSYGSMERDFYGAASGLAFIRKAGNYFENEDCLSSPGTKDDSIRVDTSDRDTATVQLFDAPLPPKEVFDHDAADLPILPPRETVTTLLHVVFTQVYPMFHFLDEEEFQASTDRIYRRSPADYQETDQSFLPLLHLVMALGHLFSRDEHEKRGCRMAVAEAMRHFILARSMLDIAHMRTIISLQTIVALILYLVSTARMASAHVFLGATCAAAMRQGLHFRSTHEADFPLKEKKVRRRVFWAVMNLDMYITSILGLPPFMDTSAVDPAIDLTISSALNQAKTDTSLSAADGIALVAAAKHIELMRVVFRAQRTLFPKPIDPPDATSRHGTISVSVQKLEEVEKQFREWAQSLTELLAHPDDSIGTQSVKYEIHLCYYFAQIVLYRAFLHYLVKQHEDGSVEQRQLAYAQTCVRMAKKAVETSVDHHRRGLLCPASWSSVYSIFISIVCLVFSYATRKQGTTDVDTRKDIENGIRLLARTACTTDTGSVRCLEILRRLIERVSDTVDVDIDEICAETRPCCAPVFTPKAQQRTMSTTNKLELPPKSSVSAARSASVSSMMPSVALSGHHWSLSPDVNMTQPSLSEITHQILRPHSQLTQQEAEELIDVPLGGCFDWQDTHIGSHPIPLSPNDGPASQHTRERATQTERKLTAEDIAAFMHSNHVEDFDRRQRG